MSDLVMSFDFGTKRIGIAIGQKVTGTANALDVVTARDGIPDWTQIDKLVEEWRPKLFVVGLPINMDGSESDMSIAASKFARRLNGRYNISAEMMDERLSTFEAKEFDNQDQLDALAAKLILESWLSKDP